MQFKLKFLLILLGLNLTTFAKTAETAKRSWKVAASDPSTNWKLLLLVIVIFPLFLYLIYKLDNYLEKKRKARRSEDNKQ